MSCTSGNYSLRSIDPINYVMMYREDANRLGLGNRQRTLSQERPRRERHVKYALFWANRGNSAKTIDRVQSCTVKADDLFHSKR